MKAIRQMHNHGWLPLMLMVLALADQLHAAVTTNTWTRNASYSTITTNWSVAGNWNSAPANGGSQDTSLLFGPGNGTVNASNDFSSVPFVLNSLVFSNNGMGLVLLGNSLQFAGSSGDLPPTIAQNVAQGATVNNALNLAANLTVGGISSGSLTLGGPISGTGSLTKNGSYLLALNGTNTYSGGTVLNTGTLSLGTNWALGSSSLVISGGVLQASKPVSLSNDVQVAGESVIGGAAALTLSNLAFSSLHTLTNSNTAVTTITGASSGPGTLFGAAGNLVISNAAVASGVSLQACGGGITLVGGGTFDLTLGRSAPTLVAGLPSTVTLNPLAAGNNTFFFPTVTNGAAAMGTLVINSALAGSTNVVTVGSLIRNGHSTLALAPQNGLGVRGQVSILSGASPVNGILPPWIVSTANGGEFLASGVNGLTNATYTVTWNTANGTNTVTPTSSDIVKVTTPTMLTNDIAAFALNVQNGRINLNGHTVTLGGGALGGLILTNGVALTNGGTLALNGTENLVFVGAGNTAFVAADLSGAGNLTKFGLGTLVLTNFATLHSGDTLIDAGTLNVNPAQDFLYTNNINGGGTLAKDGPFTFTVINSTGTLTGVSVNKGTLAFSGGLRNEQFPPTVASNATLLLSDGATYLNNTTNTMFGINGSLLMPGSTAAVSFVSAAGTLQLNAGGSLALDGGAQFAVTNGGVTVNSGTLAIGSATAPATLTASGSLSASGSGGTLAITNGTLFAKGLSMSSCSLMTMTILPNGVLDLLGGSIPQATGNSNTFLINGGLITNMVNDGSSWSTIRIPGGFRSSLTVINGGVFAAPTNGSIMIGGTGGGGGNTFTVGPGGIARIGSFTVGGGNDTGNAGTSLNQMIVSNGVVFGTSGASIGQNNNNMGSTMASNTASIVAGSYWNIGGIITVGKGNKSGGIGWGVWNSLLVDASVATNGGALVVGSGAYTSNNTVTITNNGQLYTTSVAIGSPSSNNAVLVTSGGLLEAANSLAVGPAAGGNAFTNAGGVLQFTNATPTITASGNAVINNGTLSFRGVTNVNVLGNWSGTQLTNLTFLGNNAFRLCASTNAAATNQTYVFDPALGATNYARLEMVGGPTCYRGQNTNSLTIGTAVGTGGQMLCSNTTALVTIPFTNNGTLTIVNSTLTFATNAVINGTVAIDLGHMASTGRVLNGGKDLTLGASSTLFLTGTVTNMTLGTVSGTLSGTFGSVQGLPSAYTVTTRNGQIAIINAPPTTVIFLQ